MRLISMRVSNKNGLSQTCLIRMTRVRRTAWFMCFTVSVELFLHCDNKLEIVSF